jgi:hypothetical protein
MKSKSFFEVLGVDGRIEMDLKELSWQCVDWIYMVWDKHQCRDLAMTKELLASQRASASWCLSFVLDSSQSDVGATNHRPANKPIDHIYSTGEPMNSFDTLLISLH